MVIKSKIRERVLVKHSSLREPQYVLSLNKPSKLILGTRIGANPTSTGLGFTNSLLFTNNFLVQPYLSILVEPSRNNDKCNMTLPSRNSNHDYLYFCLFVLSLLELVVRQEALPVRRPPVRCHTPQGRLRLPFTDPLAGMV